MKYLNNITVIIVLLLISMFTASSAQAGACWFDQNGRVQNGWEAPLTYNYGRRVCCPRNTSYYEESTNRCLSQPPRDWYSSVSADYISASYGNEGVGGEVFVILLVALLYWIYTNGKGNTSTSDDEPDRPVTVYEPVPEPRAPRPKVVMHDFNPKPPKKPEIVYVSKDGPALKPEKPAPAPTPAPEPKVEAPRPVVSPSGNDYVKRHVDELIHQFGYSPDTAARIAQENFKAHSTEKQRREMQAREGIPPKKN